jgi:hypothetical protein
LTCEFCKAKGHRYNFTNRCCLVRWLRTAYKGHAKAYLDQYRIRNGETKMLELIAEVKASETNS